jgi:hypothetical protein
MSGRIARRWISAGGVVALLLGVQVATQVVAQAPAGAALPRVVQVFGVNSSGSQTPKIARAECPEGMRVLGGGGHITGIGGPDRHVVLTRLQPIHTNNRDRFEVAAAADETGEERPWQARAVAWCADADVLPDYEIRSNTFEDVGEHYRTVPAVCAEGTKTIGGGARVTGGQGQVHLYRARPEGSARRAVWAGAREDRNGYPRDWTLTAYAVCASIDITIVEGSTIQPGISLATCPSGEQLIGAGANIGPLIGHSDLILETMWANGSVNLNAAGSERPPGIDDDWRVTAYAYCTASEQE